MSEIVDDGCSAADERSVDSRLVELLEASRPFLRQLAEQLVQGDLRRRIDPSDVVQETLLRAVERLGEFQGGAPSAQVTWLKEILRNLMTDLVRHHRAAKRDVGREVELPAEPAGSDRSPSSAVRRREVVDRIGFGLRQLTPDQSEVIQLRSQGLTFSEIGERTGKSADASRMLWGRAVARLTELLRHDDSTS